VLLALQRLGAVAVPVGVREQRPGLAYIAQQCGARGIVFDQVLADRVPLPDEAPALTVRLPAESLAALPAGLQPPAPASCETDTTVILYTSGTTGHPKGAMLTQLNIVHSVLHYEACMRLQRGDRSALAVPASHVTGLVAVMPPCGAWPAAWWWCRVQGRCLRRAAGGRARHAHAMMVPAMYKLCLMQPGLGPGRPVGLARRRLRRRADAGGHHRRAVAARAHADAAERYGATETTSPATMMPAGRPAAMPTRWAWCCPRPTSRDGRRRREVPPGETGELWIAGPMVVPGYWANPEATAASFTAGYWHSGDLGSVDARAFVRVFDRKKDMLNRGGYKIYSVEVENTC
jgi:long-chain acyl-CoA synthetase